MFGVPVPLLSLGFNPEFHSCVRLVLKAGELTGIFWHKMEIEIGEIESLDNKEWISDSDP